jgi:type IV pilus assembly protein PilQ
MYPKLFKLQPAVFLVFCLLIGLSSKPVLAESTPKAPATSYLIQAIKSNQQGDAFSIEIVGNTPPVYTMYELFNPARLILDIANATVDKKINAGALIPDNNLVKLSVKPLPDQDPPINRFEMTIKDGHTYTVDRDKNNLLILIHPKSDSAQTAKPATAKETSAPQASSAQTDAASAPTSSQPAKKEVQKPVPQESKTPAEPTLEKLIATSTTALMKGKTKEQSDEEKSKDSLKNSFDFGKYKGVKRISVDFYKIDLHNVFRLFREISGTNIIVDEAVKGSLTLALNDVPWDFALDIILNLKNLRKEERYNTIVIYPAEKAFVWPERAQDNLSVEADIEIVQQEQNALIIEQSAAQSEEMEQSREFIRKGRVEENADNMEKAAALYEQALKLDPKNVKLTNRLAAIYLVNLGMNAKAVHFAKEGLKIQPKSTQAALYAAIGLANMGQSSEAAGFFAQSISDPTPMKEALLSYASFSEQNGQPDNALKLLTRYNTLYGESVDTMVAKARIYDQMGQADKAEGQYRALLASGFPLAPGLKEYAQSRLGAKSSPGM